MITIYLLIISAFTKSIMDTLQFHFDNSIFSHLKHLWWNPLTSWKNKWKNGDPSQGERFWGSSRWFVRFTDAWHFFQGMMITCLMLSIVLYQTVFSIWIDFFVMYFIFTFTFEIMFRLWKN